MNHRTAACCFTGHRTIAKRHADCLTDTVLRQIRALREKGVTDFIAGGAVGFDTLAALAVLKARETDDAIRLILAVPCLNQTEKWGTLPNSLELLRTYKEIMGKADEVIYVSERTYFDGCMKLRNQFMVDHASCCIAYWNGSHGGTSQTVRMAEKAGLTLINVYDKAEER